MGHNEGNVGEPSEAHKQALIAPYKKHRGPAEYERHPSLRSIRGIGEYGESGQDKTREIHDRARRLQHPLAPQVLSRNVVQELRLHVMSNVKMTGPPTCAAKPPPAVVGPCRLAS